MQKKEFDRQKSLSSPDAKKGFEDLGTLEVVI